MVEKKEREFEDYIGFKTDQEILATLDKQKNGKTHLCLCLRAYREDHFLMQGHQVQQIRHEARTIPASDHALSQQLKEEK